MTDPTMKHFLGRIQIPEDKATARYFKMSIFKQPRADGAQFEDDPLASQSFRVPGSIPIIPGSVHSRLAPSGTCIYCGTTEFRPGDKRPLSDEHIVSGALGGNFVLPEASCQKCAEYTSGVESAVLNDLFWAARHKLKLRSSTRNRRRRDFKFSTVVGGQEVILRLPLDMHPTVLFMPSFFAPGILTSGASGIAGLSNHWLNDLTLSNADEILTPALHREDRPCLHDRCLWGNV
jgi:hypothetical protein